MKRKVLALIMSCMMLVSMAVSAATYSDVPETHDRYEAINMLSSLDIITGYPDGTFQPDKEVTRAEMAALITRMFKLDSTAVTEPPFSDVEVDYWAAANIVAAKNMNIINGFPDGTFRPQDNVTYEQAVKMIVCALNYGTAAEALGGYPGGYITQASKLNILNKAAYGNTSPAPRGIIAQLLFNSLTVERLVAQINADGTINYVKSEGGNSVLEQFQKTKTLTGATVVRTPRVNMEPGVPAIQSVNNDAIYVKTVAGEYIKLNVGSYATAFDFIGQAVDVVYREEEGSDVKTLTSITKSGSVLTYENIKLSNVVSLDATGLTYYTNKENNQTKKLTFSGTTKVIYNERLDTSGFATINADLFSVSDHTYAEGVISVYVGTNTLVKAKSYKNYVVESTNANNEVIKVKGAVVRGVAQSNIDISIPYKETHINETVIKKGNFDFNTGKAVANASNLSSYSGIAKGNIIAVAFNDQDPANRYYEVLVSSSTLSGTVNESTTDDETGRPLVKIGNSASMAVSRDIDRYELAASVQADVNAKFYIDPFNQIGYVSDVKAGDIRLGLPVNVTTGGTGFDKITQLEIYNVATNSVETLRFRDEVSGDPRVNVLKDGSGNLITDSLFKYTLKNGQIDTLEALTAGTDDYTYVAAKSAVTEVPDVKKTSSTNISFDSGKTITYNASTTKIIVIGSLLATETVTPKTGSMTTNTEYTGKVYQMNNKNSSGYNMQYVIIRPFEGLTSTAPTYIVESVGGTVPMGDVNAVTLNVYDFTGTSKSGNGSNIKSLKVTEDVKNALQLKKGDVFSYYSLPTTSGIDIETLRNVYIVARADDIANGTYPTTGHMTATDNAQAATGGYNNNYRFWGIQSNQSTLVGPTSNNVYAYYLGVPMTFITDDSDTFRTLRMAKDNTTKLPILPGDTADIATMEANYDNSDYFYNYEIDSLANIYVYDATASESEKLIQIKGKDQVRTYLDSLETIENNSNNTTKKHDTLLVKAYNTDSTSIALYNLYIIKDAR